MPQSGLLLNRELINPAFRLLSCLAYKVRRIVDVAAALILHRLWISAQGPCHRGVMLVLRGVLRGDNRGRCRAFLHPLFQRSIYAMLRIVERQLADLAKRVGTRTTVAVLHSQIGRASG